MANRRGKGGSSDRFPLWGLQNHCRWWLQPWNQKRIASWQESDEKPRQYVEKQNITLPTKVHVVKAIVFPMVTYSCDSWMVKKSGVLKNCCLWTVRLEKTSEIPLDSKIKQLNLKRNQPWILIGKVPDAGKDWGQKEKRGSEDEMGRCHHQCNEHELGQTLGDGEGQGDLACCSP